MKLDPAPLLVRAYAVSGLMALAVQILWSSPGAALLVFWLGGAPITLLFAMVDASAYRRRSGCSGMDRLDEERGGEELPGARP